MSDFKPDFTALRQVPSGKIRRTNSHTPTTLTGRSPFYYPNQFTSKNRPKDGLLPSPQIDFNRMYSPNSLRIAGPGVAAEIERSRSPSPANAIRFTPLHHPHDTPLSIKREAPPTPACSATSGTTANSVPSKFQTPLLLAPNHLTYPPFICLPPLPPHHLAVPTPSSTGTAGHQRGAVLDPTGPVSFSENSIKRLSKCLMPDFQDDPHSPEPPMRRSPSSSSDEFKSTSLRGFKGGDPSGPDSDYESGSSNSASALQSPLEGAGGMDRFLSTGPPSNLSESDRSSSCCSPLLSSDSDSLLNAPARAQGDNRSQSYRSDSSSSSSPEPPQYPFEDVLFIDNKKPSKPHLSSPATTPCSSHVCLPGAQSVSLPSAHSHKDTFDTSTTQPQPQPQQLNSYYVPNNRTTYSPHHSNNIHKHHGHQHRRRPVRGDSHPRPYSYHQFRSSEAGSMSSQELYAHQMRHPSPCDALLSREMSIFSLESSQSEAMIRAKQSYCQKLTACVQELFEGVQFSIVGSSMNGFSTSDCDLDLCMMTPNHPTPTRKEAWDRLWEVNILLKCKNIGEMHQVINAKTPIIKFRDPECGFEVDISVNNQHGVRNTNLLRKYSKMDERVRPLIVTIKQWAKRQQICNARLGTLSSYSITLMVIFYLQCCETPVLPSLQELLQGCFEYWEFYTGDHLDQIDFNWKSSNQDSLAKLLHGFFKFYSEFNYQNIMSVRTAAVLPPSYDPLGLSYQCIRIEEPYTRENVAHSVSKPWCFSSIKTHIQNAYYLLHSSEVSSIEALYNMRPVATIPSPFNQFFL